MPEWFKNQWFLGGRHARNIAHVWISVLRIFVQDGFRDLRSVGPQSLHKTTVWVVFWGLMFEVILAGGLRGEKRKDLKRLWPEGPPDIYIYIYMYGLFWYSIMNKAIACVESLLERSLSLSLSLYIYYMSYKHYADSNLDWTLLESYRSLGGVRKETEWNMNGIWIWLVVFANVSILSQCRGEAHSTARESAEFGSRQLGKHSISTNFKLCRDIAWS